ncbi:MAG: leucine-rich repeat protein [Lachnospiraceae bacterium]|nr:leucine-rich repeat protein [Lachnospiraceae bacterium]
MVRNIKIDKKRKLNNYIKVLLLFALVVSAVFLCFSKSVNKIHASSVVTDDYEFNPDTGTLLIKTDTGFTSYSSDSNINQDNITKVTFPDNMTIIPDRSEGEGGGYFSYCDNLTSIDFNNVTNIGTHSFQQSNVENVNLEKITYIGVRAFDENPKIRSVDISSATQIADSAFFGCVGLSKVTFPSSTITYGKNAFADCGLDLTDGYPPGGSLSSFNWQMPYLYYSIDKTEETINEGDTIIPPKVTFKTEKGNDYATMMNSKPEWLMGVGGSTTYAPPTVSVSGDTLDNKEGVYHQSYNLSFNFQAVQSNVKFYRFTLTVLPKDSSDTGGGTNNVVTSDYEFNPNNGNLLIKTTMGLTSYKNDTNFTAKDVTSVSFADSITSIPDISPTAYGYFSESLSQVDLNNVTYIGACAFYGCYKITELDASKVTSIGENAFYDCELLFKLDVSNVKTFGDKAFRTCESLSEVKFPDKATYGAGAFVRCGLDLSEGYPEGGSVSSFGLQIPVVYFTLNKYSETINAGDPVVPPAPIYKSRTGKDYNTLIKSKAEWLATNISSPGITESGDSLKNKPGIYKRVYTINVSTYSSPNVKTQTFTLTVKDVSSTEATINPSEAIFNKIEGSEDNRDITVTLNKAGYSLSSITDGRGITLTEEAGYSVSGDKYTFPKKYFSTYESGENCQIQFDMSGGTSPILNVSIIETREVNGSISPVTAAYDKNPKGKYHKPIVETLELAAYDLNSIKNGSYKLVENKDYVKQSSKSSSNIQLVNASNGSVYEIKESYLNKLKNGTAKITFDLNGGTDPVLTLSVMDTSSKNGGNGGNNGGGGKSGGNGGNGSSGGLGNRYSGTIGSNIPIKTGDSANTGYWIIVLMGSIVLFAIEILYLIINKDKKDD